MSTEFYNHYSWLRTMEDIFDVATAAPGLDGDGHIGYAAQPGLAPFGRDVFTNPHGFGPATRSSVSLGSGLLSHGPLWAIPLTGLLGIAAVPVASRRRRRRKLRERPSK